LLKLLIFPSSLIRPLNTKNTPLENYKEGKLVHIEPALRFGDRIDGHLIQGHVDAIGEVLEIKKKTKFI